MALTAAEHRTMADARSILIREACVRQDQLNRLQACVEWADQILTTTEDPEAHQNAAQAHSLAQEALSRLQAQDRHSMAAVDHIDDLIGG